MKKNGFLTSAFSCDESVGEKAVLCVFISLALHFFGLVCVKKVWKSGSFSAPCSFLSFGAVFGPVLTSYSVLVWKWRSTRNSAKMGFPCLRIPAPLESCYTNVRFDGNFSRLVGVFSLWTLAKFWELNLFRWCCLFPLALFMDHFYSPWKMLQSHVQIL